MRSTRRFGPLCVAALAATLLAACGGNNNSGTTGGTTTTGGGAGALEGRGPITFATGKDTSGNLPHRVDEWNSSHPSEKATVIELPESADDQRSRMIQNAQTQSDAF